MDIPVAILITGGVAAAALVVFAGLRRIGRGPLLREATRGTPMATVVGTAFAVLMAFVILASFQTYNGAQAGAGSEAVAVLDMARTAALYPPAQRDLLRGELMCYARAVIELEWPAMRGGRSSPAVEHWIAAYRGLFGVLSLNSPREQLAFQELLNDAAERTNGRQQRLADAHAPVPTPLWLALLCGGAMTVLVQMGMTDPRERPWVQGPMIAAVAVIVTVGLLLVHFLGHPYQPHMGAIQPAQMRQTLNQIQQLEPTPKPICAPDGRSLALN